jgi:hypothetical protein
MPLQVLQRPGWRGEARNLGDAFRLYKGKRLAVCELWSHQSGWELRFSVAGHMLATRVCRSQEDVFDTYDAWRAIMMERGWRSAPKLDESGRSV